MHPVLFRIGSILIPSYGAITAFGVLLALALAQRTARIARVDPVKVWNLCILSLFAALAAARLLLVVANWSALRRHPAWLLGLGMVHHPLLAATGALAGTACAAWYAHRKKLPLAATADAIAPALALGLAFEQLGALASGSGYGIDALPGFRLAITYSNPLAAIWSGTPLGVPLHPVQAYAAMAFLAIAILLYVWLPFERRRGDVAGLWLFGAGATIYLTEMWRDQTGRGSLLHGVLDGPQIAALLLVLAAVFVLWDRKSAAQSSSLDSPVASPPPSTAGPGPG